MGLPYAFASHFAPAAMEQALGLYRQGFRPSKRLAKPHVMLALNVVGAESEAEARRLYTTQQQTFVRLRRGGPGLVRSETRRVGKEGGSQGRSRGCPHT